MQAQEANLKDSKTNQILNDPLNVLSAHERENAKWVDDTKKK